MHRTSPLCTQNHKWNHKSKSVCKYNSFLTTWCSSQLFFCKTKKTKKMKFPEMDTYPGEGHIDRFIVYTIKSCHVSFSKPCAHLGDFSFVFFCFFLKLPENKLAKRINEINRKPELVRTQDSPMRF